MRWFKSIVRSGSRSSLPPPEVPGMRELLAQTRLNGKELDKMSAAVIHQAQQIEQQHSHLTALTRSIERLIDPHRQILKPDIDITSISAFRRLEMAIIGLTEAQRAPAEPPPKRRQIAVKARRTRKRG